MRSILSLIFFLTIFSCKESTSKTDTFVEFNFPHRSVKVDDAITIKILENLKPTKSLSEYAILQYSDLVNEEYLLVEKINNRSGRVIDPIKEFSDKNDVIDSEWIDYANVRIFKAKINEYGSSTPMMYWITTVKVNRQNYLIYSWTVAEKAKEFNNKVLMMIHSFK